MIFLKFDRRIFQHFDGMLLTLVLAICAMGILNIYSTGFSAPDGQSPFYLKQLQWIIIGLFLTVLIFFVDYRVIAQYAYVIYGVTITFLILVLVVGYSSHGAQRWIGGGFFVFQPSEMMKVVIILTLARYFDDHRSHEPYKLHELFVPFLIVAVPFALILKQPDLGTALMLMIIFASIIFFMGVDRKSLLFSFVSGLIAMPIGWLFLKDYQRERLITFLNPERDPLGSGYHIIQSKIAIGSGKILGKGFLSGSQTQLKFLPEQRTDFVFSVFAEEWGFIGGMILITMFTVFIFWGLKIALQARDLLGTILAFGITALIAWEVFINIGMVLGILPVVGIPLPFFSYGGSAMLSLMVAVGLLINVGARKFILQR